MTSREFKRMVLAARALERLELQRDKLIRKEQWLLETEKKGEATMATLSAKKEVAKDLAGCQAAIDICRAQRTAAEKVLSSADEYIRQLLREHYFKGKSWVLLSALDGYNSPDSLRKTATRYLARESWKQ